MHWCSDCRMNISKQAWWIHCMLPILKHERIDAHSFIFLCLTLVATSFLCPTQWDDLSTGCTGSEPHFTYSAFIYRPAPPRCYKQQIRCDELWVILRSNQYQDGNKRCLCTFYNDLSSSIFTAHVLEDTMGYIISRNTSSPTLLCILIMNMRWVLETNALIYYLLQNEILKTLQLAY